MKVKVNYLLSLFCLCLQKQLPDDKDLKRLSKKLLTHFSKAFPTVVAPTCTFDEQSKRLVKKGIRVAREARLASQQNSDKIDWVMAQINKK
jgi:hypothetical protein